MRINEIFKAVHASMQLEHDTTTQCADIYVALRKIIKKRKDVGIDNDVRSLYENRKKVARELDIDVEIMRMVWKLPDDAAELGQDFSPDDSAEDDDSEDAATVIIRDDDEEVDAYVLSAIASVREEVQATLSFVRTMVVVNHLLLIGLALACVFPDAPPQLRAFLEMAFYRVLDH